MQEDQGQLWDTLGKEHGRNIPSPKAMYNWARVEITDAVEMASGNRRGVGVSEVGWWLVVHGEVCLAR